MTIPHAEETKPRRCSSCSLFARLCALACLLPTAGQAQTQPILVLQTGHPTSVHSLTYSPDGRWLASAGGHVAKLWETSTGMEMLTLAGHGSEVAGVAFSPDGRTLATASWDRTVRLWKIPSGEPGAILSGHAGGILCVTFSRDGRFIATGDNRGTVKVWDAATGTMISSESYEGLVNAVAFHPQGTLLAIATGDPDSNSGSIVVWNLVEKRRGPVLSGHAGEVWSVAFSPDGRWLASGSADRAIKLWEVATWQERRTLAGHGAAVNAVLFAPNGNRLASGGGDRGGNSDDAVRIWDVASGREIHKLSGNVKHAEVAALAFTPDGKYLAAGGFGPITIWDAASGVEHQQLAGRVSGGKQVAFSRSGRWLAAADSSSVALWDLGQGRGPRVLRGQREAFDSVAFSADERWLAARAHREIKVWETATGNLVANLRGTDCSFGGLAFSADGASLAAASCKLVRLWQTATWQERAPLTGHVAVIESLVSSPEGGLFVTVGSIPRFPDDPVDTTIRFWDAAEAREIPERGIRTDGTVTALAFGATDSFLAIARGHGEISVAGKPNLRFRHPAFVTALAISSENRRLASAGCGEAIQLWDVSSASARALSGHTGCVRSLAFSPDGRWLASTGDDGSTRLWSANEGKQVALLSVMWKSDDWAIVAPDGLFDASAAGSQELMAWRIGTRLYPPDRFFADYFTPGLLADILAGKRPKARVDLAAMRLPPEVRITSPTGSGIAPEQQIRVGVEAKNLGGGVAEVRLYHNGKLAASQVGKSGPTSQHEFGITLVAGENRLVARGFSEARVESNEDVLRLFNPIRGVTPVAESGAQSAALSKPALRLLAVGINDFEDPDFNLRYARPDAQSIAEFFEKRRALFASVTLTRLIDKEATKAGIENALRELESQSEPTDVVLIYLAGHGVSLGQQWYFLPYDMRKEADDEAAVRKHGISGIALSQSLLQMKALKQVLVIDACQSGGVLTSLAKSLQFRSAAEEKALKMLARANGFHMIAASTDVQYAFEVPELRHGVMTYALLQGLGEDGQVRAPTVEKGIVTVTSLLQYIGQQVPDLTERHHQGNKQYPVQFSTGMDFPLCYCVDR